MQRSILIEIPTFLRRALLAVLLLALAADGLHAQSRPGQNASIEDYYRLQTLPLPDGVALEGTGLAILPDDRLAVGTRRGEIWLLQNPYMHGGEQPRFSRFAHGLHEPIGLAFKDGAFYAAQRGELTRIKDTVGDGIANVYETVYAWPQTGNHHAYSYGPKILPDGRMWVAFGLDSPFGGQIETASYVLWRGWTGFVSNDGTFEPIATGMKQPVGFDLNAEGDMFFVDHDGRWVGSGYLSHVEKGDFLGHPAGLRWKDHPDSPVEMERTHLEVPREEMPMYEAAVGIPAWKLPAVWLPHGSEIGQGAQNAILADTTGGHFGPFEGQLFISDHTDLSLARVFLEKVDGEYQGVAFPFLGGLLSGPVAQAWGSDGSMFIGMTDRGWTAGGGEEPHGLQRIEWTGEVPFEMKAVRAMPDGFELEFTKPADPDELNDPAKYDIQSFIYEYRSAYASPIIEVEDNPILGVRASEDGTRVRLVVDNLRRFHIHEINLGELASRDGTSLLHDVAYYTLNNIPDGERLALEEMVRPDVPSTRVEEEADVPLETVAGNVTEMPEAWTDGPDVSVTLVAVPGLRFDRETFEVPAGARVRLSLDNEDDMLHNVVIVEPETADEVGEAAMSIGPAGMQQGYIPDSESVLYYTGILDEGESESIYFTAPVEPGTYQFVCTVPGHHISMRGTMVVRDMDP